MPSIQIIRSPVTKHTDDDVPEWVPAGRPRSGRTLMRADHRRGEQTRSRKADAGAAHAATAVRRALARRRERHRSRRALIGRTWPRRWLIVGRRDPDGGAQERWRAARAWARRAAACNPLGASRATRSAGHVNADDAMIHAPLPAGARRNAHDIDGKRMKAVAPRDLVGDLPTRTATRRRSVLGAATSAPPGTPRRRTGPKRCSARSTACRTFTASRSTCGPQ